MFLGISQETWAGVLIGAVVVPVLWWFLRKLRDWLYTTNPRAMVLGAIALNEERTCIFVRDLRVQLHQLMPGMRQEDQWPLLDRSPARLGGGIEGRGINIPVVWADVDAQSVADLLNVLGQVGKTHNLEVVRRSEDEGDRDCHLIVVGGQDQNARHFYAHMQDVYYRMDDAGLYEALTGTQLAPDPASQYGYGVILKARNPYKVTGHPGLALLVGGFGVLGTLAASHYLRTHLRDLGVLFGRETFGVVVRASLTGGHQTVERVAHLDRPGSTTWRNVKRALRGLGIPKG